jgi:hypothetical protein
MHLLRSEKQEEQTPEREPVSAAGAVVFGDAAMCQTR